MCTYRVLYCPQMWPKVRNLSQSGLRQLAEKGLLSSQISTFEQNSASYLRLGSRKAPPQRAPC